MDDSLSAISAIFTVVAILFGLWYSEIKTASELKLPLHDEDKQTIKNRIRKCRNAKGVPLLVINIVMGAIFIPDSLQVLCKAFAIFLSDAEWIYDSSKAALIAIILLSFALDFLLISDIVKMNQKLNE